MKNQSLKYLITGGLGLIGSSLANKLEGEITIISRSKKNIDRIKNKKVEFIIKSIQDLNEKDLQGKDVIYHCASTVDNYHVLDDPYIDIETNIKGTIHLLELCKNIEKKPKIIFPSTFFVYGHEFDKNNISINEESRTDPLAIYPATKLCTESIIKLYSKLYGIPYVIARLTNVYGENEDFDNKKKGGLNFLIMEAIKGNTLSLYNNGDFYRDYIYVDDVVSALMMLEKEVNNDLYLVGYGEPIKFKTLIDCILELSESNSRIIPVDPTPFHKIVGINNFVADTAKIRSLGWKPLVDYKEGLRRIVKRYKTLIK